MKTWIKYTALRALVAFKWWANTEKGEKQLVAGLTTLSVLFIISAALLVVGYAIQ